MPVVTIGGRKVFVVPSITPHEPITILGDHKFIPEKGIVSGSGTSDDPFIIENWDINASADIGIYITDTASRFIIRNCIIHDGKNKKHTGIQLSNVQNGKIEHTTSYKNTDGIMLESDCLVNKITDCDIYDNISFGIWLHHASDTQISNCKIHKNEQGIHLYNSSNNIITNCSLYDSSDGGVYLDSSSKCKIHYCNIYNNNKGIHNISSGSSYRVDAIDNWWEDASGPHHPITNQNGLETV